LGPGTNVGNKFECSFLFCLFVGDTVGDFILIFRVTADFVNLVGVVVVSLNFFSLAKDDLVSFTIPFWVVTGPR
jgi:hypothetical protein